MVRANVKWLTVLDRAMMPTTWPEESCWPLRSAHAKQSHTHYPKKELRPPGTVAPTSDPRRRRPLPLVIIALSRSPVQRSNVIARGVREVMAIPPDSRACGGIAAVADESYLGTQ